MEDSSKIRKIRMFLQRRANTRRAKIALELLRQGERERERAKRFREKKETDGREREEGRNGRYRG